MKITDTPDLIETLRSGLAPYGTINKLLCDGSLLIIEIGEGFDNRMVNTNDLMFKILELTNDEFRFLKKMQANKNLFMLHLSNKKGRCMHIEL